MNPETPTSQIIPWIVCSISCSVHIEKDLSSTIIASISEGTQIFEECLQDENGNEWLTINYEEIQGFALRSFFNRVHPQNTCAGNIPIGHEVISRWWGVPLEYKPTDLVELPTKWNYEDHSHMLRAEAQQAVVRLLEASEMAGLSLRVCSGFRSGERQRALYLAAMDKSGCNQRYSAPPGHSEHQLGTCVDFVEARGDHLFKESFGTTPEGIWLHQNALSYGFKRSYTPENIPQTGYISEPWHWRYWGVSG